MHGSLRRMCAVLCFFLTSNAWLAPAVALAATNGTIGGTVASPSGQPVPGAMVTVTSTKSGARSTTTDALGRFTFVVPAGFYDIRVSKGGFVPSDLTHQAVFVGDAIDESIVLTLADLGSLHSVSAVSTTGAVASGASNSAAVTKQQFQDLADPQINAALQHLAGVTAVPGIQIPDTAFLIGGTQAYETQVLIDGHPFSNGNFGVWLSEYFNSQILDGAELESGPGNVTPLANTAVGGTLNLLTPSFTSTPVVDFMSGVDSYASQFSRLRVSGSIGKIDYVGALAYGAINGPFYNTPLCSVIPTNSSLTNQPGLSGIIQFCGDGGASLYTKGEVLKLRYNISQNTSIEAGFVGAQGGYSPQGSAYGESYGPTTIVQCVPVTWQSSGSNYASQACTNPADSQYVGKTIPGYYWFPGGALYYNQPIFTSEFRTSFGETTLLVRPYASNVTHYLNDDDENEYAWNFGPDDASYNDPSAGYCNTGNGGNGYTKTPQPTVVDGYAECFQEPFAQLEHDKLYGYTVSLLRPVGSDFFTLSFDQHGDDTFAYFDSPSNVQTPDTTERYATISLAGDIRVARNLFAKTALYDTTWKLFGSTPDVNASPGPDGAIPLMGLTRSVNSIDPHVGLVFQPRANVSYRAAYGTSETYPYAGQLSGEPAINLPTVGFNGTLTVKNAQLSPERSSQFALGADLSLKRAGTVSLDLQDTHIRNVFETLAGGTVTLPSIGPLQEIEPENVAQIHAQTATLKYTYAARAGFGFNGSLIVDRTIGYGLPNAFYASGPAAPANNQQLCTVDNLNNNGVGTTTCIPYLKGYAQLTYTFRDGTFAGLGVELEGKNNAYFQPPFAQWDLVMRRPISHDLDFGLSIANLLNTNNFANMDMPNAGVSLVAGLPGGGLTNIPSTLIPTPPRTLRVYLRWHGR